jgi:hypothetical protein
MCALETAHTRGGESKNVTLQWLIINAAFFMDKNPYVSRSLDMNVMVLLIETHGTVTSHTFRKIQTSMTFNAAKPVLQREY